jgi:hypothetical protein
VRSRRIRNAPPERRPIFPPWSKSDCPECADPIEYAVLDVIAGVDVKRVAIIRAVSSRGTIAVRMTGDQLHGYTVTKLHPLRDGFVLVRPHADVCEYATPPVEQRPLFD